MAPIQTQRQECTIYSRVVGWITPTKNWNPGKKSEFGDRMTYDKQLNCQSNQLLVRFTLDVNYK